jgi:hypothetical protein
MSSIHPLSARHLAARSIGLACLLAFGGAQAATMSDAEFKAAKDRIEADAKTSRAACDGLAGNAKDICVAEAKGKERVARAELDYRRTGKESHRKEVAEARAESSYAVSKEKCDDLAGNAKDVCVQDAKAAQTRAKADAKSSAKVDEARSEATDEKHEADYKAAKERCDTLAGDAKSACIDQAKARYGKH